MPFRAVYINSPELTDHHYSAPNSYSSSIVRKLLINQQLGGVANDDHGGAFGEDFIDVGGKIQGGWALELQMKKARQWSVRHPDRIHIVVLLTVIIKSKQPPRAIIKTKSSFYIFSTQINI